MICQEEKDRQKHLRVYDELVEALSCKEFQPGARLPSERDFAERLNVNIRTVRRAFRSLVLGGIVEKRVGSGTYLKQKIDNGWKEQCFNLLIDNQYGDCVQWQLENLVKKIAERHRHPCRVVFVSRNTLPEQIRSCITYRQPTILCCSKLDDNAEIFTAPELFVAISSMIYQHGVPSVHCDDTKGINLLIDHLQKLGHRRIALFIESSAGDGLTDLHAAVWAAALGDDYRPELKIVQQKDDDAESIQAAYQTMLQAAKKLDFSAVLCLTDELMFGAMAALRECGRNIPENVSVVSVGNTPLSRFSFPPVTCFDPDLANHIEQAFQLLEYNHFHPDAIEKFRLICPKLLIRQSTAPAGSYGNPYSR